MSFVHGSKANVWLDGVDLSDYLTEFSAVFAADNPDSTTFKKTWRTFVPGLLSAEVSASGYFDPLMTKLTALVSSNAAVLTYGLGGATLGALVRTMPIRESAFEEGAEVGGLVGFDWAAISDGIPGADGRVIGTLAAVTADQNGTAVDGGAATTTGAIAHLHVTSVSAADSIIVTIEDSATGSSGWATIGTFASKAAAGAERIVIAGTIRRYTRVVDDVTGASVSITRGVALART